MGIKKLLLICVLISGSFLLSGCGNITDNVYTRSDAINTGMLLDLTSADFLTGTVNETPNLITPTIQELSRQSSFQVSLYFPYSKLLAFESESLFETAEDFFDSGGDISIYFSFNHADIMWVGMPTPAHTTFKEGDVISAIHFDATDRTQIEYNTARDRLNFFERGFNEQRSEQQSAINLARAGLTHLSGNEATRTRLQIRQMEIALERFVRGSESTRQSLTTQIEALSNTLGHEEMIAPFDGWISRFISFDFDALLPGHFTPPMLPTPRFLLVNPEVFFISLDVDRRAAAGVTYALLGIGDIVTIQARTLEGSIIEFEAKVVSDTWTDISSRFHGAAYSYLLEPFVTETLINTLLEINETANPIQTLNRANLSLSTSELLAPVGYTLPTSVIRREGGMDVISVYQDGIISRRVVQLGNFRTGTYVEIVVGVDADTLVVVP